MPLSNATTDSVELEILEIRQDSSDEDDEGAGAIGGGVGGPGAVVVQRPCSPPRRKRFRRNRAGSSAATGRRKSNSQSCGSLYNLASIRPLYPQRSEPNVNFYASGENEHEGTRAVIDINFNDHVVDSSNTLDDAPVLESCESIGDGRRRGTRSGGRRTSGGTGTSGHYGSTGGDAYYCYSGGGGGDDGSGDGDLDDACGGGCGGGIGGSSIGAGSGGSGAGGGHGPYGFKAQLVTVLERLGMWNQGAAKVTKSQIHKSDTKSSFDRGQSYISNGAGRLRSIFGGKTT